MGGLNAVAGVAVVSLGMVLTPGPNMLHLVSRSITQGRRAGLIALAGVGVGFGIYLLAATAGIITVFALVPGLHTALRVAGAAYLLWLAWKTFRPGAASAFAPGPPRPDTPRALFLAGLLTNLLNLKIALLYVSLLPQFLEPGRGDLALQSLLLGLTQITVALSVNAAIVLTASSLASFLSGRPRWLRAQRYLTGTALACFALGLLTDRSRPALAT